MKIINKIFMAIAMIILTPTVILVAFILIADATDMDLKSIGEEELETEIEPIILVGGVTEPQTEAAVQPEGGTAETNQENDQADSTSNLAAVPPASRLSTGNNGALEQQLNMDAWNANPTTSTTTSSNTNTNANPAELPDAAAYMKAYLDVTFKNDAGTYLNLNIGTADEAAELYEETLDKDTINDLLDSLGFEEVQADERLDLIKRILSSVRYNVVKAEKQNDGSYVVTIAYEKMNIYMPTVDAYIKRAESMIAGWNRAGSAGREVPSFEEMNEQLIETYTECLKESFENATYEKSQNATIKLTVVNKKYEINKEDATKFEALLTDSAEAMKKLDEAMKKWEF